MPRNIDLTEAEWTLMEQLWGAPGQTGHYKVNICNC